MEPEYMLQGVALVMEDFNLVSRILSCLVTPQDRLSVSLVCKLWNEAVILELQRVVIRSRVLLHSLLQRFSNVRELDLGHCCDELQDSDLINATPFLHRIERVLLGHPDNPQNRLSDDAVMAFAIHCPALKHIELSSCPLLSDKFIICLVQLCPLLCKVFLEDCVNFGDPALEALSRCGNLQELTLKGKFGFTPQGLGVIGEHCSALQSVRFELHNIDVGFALKSIAMGCPHILECSLKVRSVDLTDMAKCTTLTCFRMETDIWNRLDEAIIAIAEANKNLKELIIVNQYEPLSDAAVVRVIQSCRLLERLHIYAARLTGMALQCLMDCKSLKYLTLDHFQSSGQGLAEVGLCGLDLKCLSLRSGRGIRDVELQTLVQGNRRLELLDLQCCHGLSPIGFSAIAQCMNLQSLNMSFTQVDNLSLMTIADGIKSLKRLSLVKCESISDMGIVVQFSALESLNLDQCPFVNDEGLDSIATYCSQLVHLSLAFTQITDKGLFCLTQCSQLRSLRIPYCRRVEGPGIVALSKECAWLQFVVLSHRFRGTKTLEELKKQFCMTQLEADDMALVPFGFNLLM
ncbi:hypothetical protein GOP47_0009691 [Adiantum capillus-veneris]|uniref:Uncharacterized protein n=1 Tax=Adiantum capillus-veneris TaxID=13818 RepID=A0A9D4UWQ6_ADICA|nr:hypothetical protein GOP47_0009691 [Adiantum capillus-veneris]